MRYTFACDKCGKHFPVEASIKAGPPDAFPHGDGCPGTCARQWTPCNFIAHGDPDEIPYEHQTADVGGGIAADGSLLPTTHTQVVGPSRERARQREKRYQSYIEERRSIFREHGQKGGRMTHQVPIELYHGKIKQTGDKDYWRDESNLKKHRSCKVS